MKKRYKKLLLFLSLCFSMLIGFTISSYAYYLDNTGNLVSNNLFENTFNYSSSGFSVSTTNQTTTISGINNSVTFLDKSVELEPGDYYLSVQNSTDPNNTGLDAFVEINNVRYNSNFTITSSGTYYVFLRIQLSSSVNYSFNIMLNSGSSALIYEPYGTYYSYNNYTNYGASQYSQGYTDGFNSVYNSLVDVNLSEHITGIGCGIYNSTGTTFVQNGTITSSYFENSYYYFNINPVIDGNYYIIPISFDNNYVFSSFRWSPNRFTSPSLIINGVTYDSSTVSYNGSTYGWDNLNVNLDSAVNSVEFKFKINSNFEGVNLYINGKNLEIATALESYQTGYDNGQTVGYQNGYSEGFAAGSQSVTTDNTNFQKLIWTIGSTPFESFKTIWNVDVMGLNISGIILGGLMALLVLYLIKKIWK